MKQGQRFRSRISAKGVNGCVDGTGNQVESSIRANMELRLVETVCYHLIAILAHAIHHLLAAMDNI